MKKIQRSFAVEYKSGRRKSDPKPNSIWGDMDLKAVARDVEETAMPVLPNPHRDDKSTKEISSLIADHPSPILTPPTATSKPSADTEEMLMAEDTGTITKANTPASAETSTGPKKQRKRRVSKNFPDLAAADTAAEPAVEVQKRRGRTTKAIEGVAVVKRTPVKGAPKAKQAATMVPMSASDEMADLLLLEDENQKLRKLLADKLRSENTELRKKLKLD